MEPLHAHSPLLPRTIVPDICTAPVCAVHRGGALFASLRVSFSAAGNVTVPVEDLNAVLAGSGGTSTATGSNATDLIEAPAGTNVTLSLAQLGQVRRG